MTPKAAAELERARIVAYLRFNIEEYGIHTYAQLADDLANGDHWDRWDELDDEGQAPYGTKDPWKQTP